MPFNISSFKSNGLVYGGARPSLFEVYLSVPQGIGIDSVSVDKFRFVCRTAEIPESTVGSIPIPYFGRVHKVAGERTFNDWGVTVMNDEDFSVRSLFETWSNAINRLVSNVRDPNISNETYKTDLEVIQYAKDGSKIRSYQIVGAFPTSIGAINLGWDSTNQIEEFAVTFSYDYWVPVTEASDKKAGGVNIYGASAQIDGPAGP
ncbi:tail tube protein [uncultured Caudovirales phage]|uniref:Tail tube protein n=1 Tax=uncultured Caudovirales phage TaxID=2100421 RepID=A0A6J5NYT1_9CAUD|nr:tail tube protein [uncultured Caudovirales phage]